MHHTNFLRASAAALVLVGCSSDHGVVQPVAMLVPDRELTAPVELLGSRAGRLEPNIDTVALQRLLAAVPAEARPLVRATFEEHGNRFYQLHSIEGISGVQAMVDEVRAPRRLALERRRAEESSFLEVWSAPLTVVLISDTVGATPGITIQRYAEVYPRDVVILRSSDANANRLSEAVRALARLRRRDGVLARQDFTLRLMAQPARSTPGSEPNSWTKYLDAKLAQLRAATPRLVPGIGMARVIEIQSLGQ